MLSTASPNLKKFFYDCLVAGLFAQGIRSGSSGASAPGRIYDNPYRRGFQQRSSIYLFPPPRQKRYADASRFDPSICNADSYETAIVLLETKTASQAAMGIDVNRAHMAKDTTA